MRLVWVYVSHKPYLAPVPWDSTIPPTNKFGVSENLEAEGFHYLFRKLLEAKIIDECLIFIDSGSGMGRYFDNYGIEVVVAPHIDCLDSLLKDDDILLVRGGFKPWFTFLQRQQALDRWLLFYRAATNRGVWPFWDVVLEDLMSHRPFMDSWQRVYLPFVKPTNEELFYLTNEGERPHDVMIGASHIHDKKGQWRVVDALKILRERGILVKAILPGRFYGGEETRRMFQYLETPNLLVAPLGMIPRVELATYYNQTKLFVHAGGGGQNDRGVLEAMWCGCNILMTTPEVHAPLTYVNPAITRIVDATPLAVADGIVASLAKLASPTQVSLHMKEVSSNSNTIVPWFAKLLNFLKVHKKSDKLKLLQEGL
jgi:glycosyltransferase involved in cell wall biosynthesis